MWHGACSYRRESSVARSSRVNLWHTYGVTCSHTLKHTDARRSQSRVPLCIVTVLACLLREVKLLRELSHSNVVKLYDVFSDWDKKQMHLVFELGTFCVAVLV